MKNDNCLLCILVAVFTAIHVKVEGGKGGGGSHHEFTNNNILHFTSHKTNFTFSRFSKIEFVQNV